jgi:hypothetical protein
VYLGGQSPNVSSVGTPVSGNTCSTPISKSMITNASFRTKKLPGKKKTIFVHLEIKLYLYKKIYIYSRVMITRS